MKYYVTTFQAIINSGLPIIGKIGEYTNHKPNPNTVKNSLYRHFRILHPEPINVAIILGTPIEVSHDEFNLQSESFIELLVN